MLYDKFDNRIIITGKLVALDPIHIGSSTKNSLNPIDVDNSVLKDSQGRPVIPGSSIKGLTRFFFESVLRNINESSACNVLEEKECCTEKTDVKNEIKRLRDKGSHEELATYSYEKSCEACKLFGGREFAGKLMFKDCFLIGDVKLEHRDGVGIDRKTGAYKSKAKYDYEIIPKGSEFEFYLLAENLDEKQMKYLDFIIRHLESGNLSVGGKVTRGLGRFKLTVTKREVIDIESLKAELKLKEGRNV
ncbi:MAG: CRISPR-associated RAMP protein [Clostridiales bacterium]|nr:CRISPR-associated RAMP protein [Clostridiales bacterium]